MTKAPVIDNDLPILQRAFADTEASLNTRLVERQEFIRILLLALIGKLDVFGLGAPGVAKTQSVTLLRDHIEGFPDDGYYWRPMTNFSTPPDLFGPPDVKALREEGIWRHVTANTMVHALLVLLDEIFKANPAILQALLTYLNERKFRNDVMVDVPCWTVIGLSNEFPEGKDLNAMYDRLDLRSVIKPISSASGFMQMLRTQALEPVTPTLTVEQIVAAQGEVTKVEIGDDVYDGLLSLRQTLKRAGVTPTDRKFARTLQAIRAGAWLRGSTLADLDDIGDARHMLWDTLDDKPIVDVQVLGLSSPIDALAMTLRTDVDGLTERFDEAFRIEDELERNKKAMDLHDKILRSIKTNAGYKKDLGGRRSVIVEELEARLGDMNSTILRECFGLDPDDEGVDG